MSNLDLYARLSTSCSKAITKEYSTSFFSAIKLLSNDLRKPIYAIYGMVRLADEIVDTFHDYDKEHLLQEFEEDTFKAIEQGISLNPILHAFQLTVREHKIDLLLIKAFFASMRLDLYKKDYLTDQEFKEYIYGSAEVVGLMCLAVFCNGNKANFDALKVYARALGAAFQKINFLRDIQADLNELERQYFPGFDAGSFDEKMKREIESEIELDFKLAYEGIKRLPLSARFGVYVAYRYYLALFKKVKRSEPEAILNRRIRIPNHAKFVIVLKAGVRNQLNLI